MTAYVYIFNVNMYVSMGEINIRAYDNFYFLAFNRSLNKNFIYIYCIRIYSTNMCI